MKANARCFAEHLPKCALSSSKKDVTQFFPSKADIGQEENFEEVEKKALKFGAKKVRIFSLFNFADIYFKYIGFFNILFETLLSFFVFYFLNHGFI